MRKLIRQIERELKTAKHCAIYAEELSRVWPDDGKQGEVLIAQFAQDNGFRLRFYRDGLCAIFDKPPQTPTRQTKKEREREQGAADSLKTADALLALGAAWRHEPQAMHSISCDQPGERLSA